jgi:Na+/melibiose symporter-like transporter
VLGAFAWWESRVEHPMLDWAFFRNPRFTAASSGIMLLFFAMFGSMFLMTQYLQFVMGYSPIEAGVRLLPMAITMLIVAPSSARLVERFGTKGVVATGLFLASAALASFAMLPSYDVSYPGDVMWRLIVMAAGMGLVMAPATESIMGSLPRAKAGVGSAVNDTTRQVGGTLGVAVIGSVMSSAYASRVSSSIADSGLDPPPEAVAQAKEGLGRAFEVIASAPAQLRPQLIAEAQSAFVAGMHRAVLVAALAGFVGFLVVLRWLPARAASTEVFIAQDVEEARAEAEAEAAGRTVEVR